MFDALLGPLARRFGKPAPVPSWVEAGQLRQRLAGSAAPLILDVRGPDEFDGPLGHIADARNIPLPELGAHRAELAAAGRPIVCVCLTDKRSAAAASQLMVHGLKDVAVLRGGMTAWGEVGL